jgi:hypothetical protein
MLRCYDVTMLRCYDVTMLRCYDVTMLRCSDVPMFTMEFGVCQLEGGLYDTIPLGFLSSRHTAVFGRPQVSLAFLGDTRLLFFFLSKSSCCVRYPNSSLIQTISIHLVFSTCK